jgi:cytochrome c oxidase subunit 2
MGNDLLKAPRLSGLSDWYIANQLHAFRNGWRGRHAEDLVGMEMQPMATALTDDEIAAAAEFASSTVSAEPVASIDGDAENGKALYASCAACHGDDGTGNEALKAPALVGQNDWYLLHQIENYRDGRRGYVAEDSFGQQMRASVNLLDDDEALLDVVKYITTLPSQ